ncbi:putative saccharopine dehydrogenase [Papilio machaon]|uniref:Putative saccharopine dehydrogenase n=1 Tax=Papilio machaon TaxID=76193 RepID=A0A194QVQ0_PAPMA|nr:putative saccharopine dehydrogenase [Papilio machaon]
MDKVDIIVIGATGFTGKHVVQQLAAFKKHDTYKTITWGISGRSKDKVNNLLSEIEEYDVDVTKILTIISDVKDDSICNVTNRARIVINCTGPNTLLSEYIVKACVHTGTHYVDISAELYHMLNVYRAYHKRAEEAGVLIVPSCGFASIPTSTGLILLDRHFKGSLHTAECYVELHIPRECYYGGRNKTLVHYGTWEAFVFEMANMKKYKDLKKKTFPEVTSESVPREIKKSFFHKHERRWWFPYPGPDYEVDSMAQIYFQEKRGKKPIHFRAYTTMPLCIHFLIIPLVFIAYFLCKLKCFRNLMWKHPGFFSFGLMSHKGPSEKLKNDLKYTFTLIGKGNDPSAKEHIVKITGSDPAYKSTATTALFSAVTILLEGSKIPKGGVLMPESAFYETDIVERLKSNGINYEIVDNRSNGNT